MDKYGLTLAILISCALLLLPQAGESRTLKIATLAPEGTTWMKEMRQGAERISERTQGRVKFKFYPGGVMGNDRSVMRKIRIGQLQGGAFTAGGLSDVYPDIQIYGLPMLFRDYGEVDAVRAHVDARLRQGLEERGLVALGIGEGGFAYLMCQRPMRSIDDLKGQKVWVPEGDVISEAVFRVAGITPVPLPIADVYTGLQTGLVDTIASSPVAAIAFQWHTRVQHLTDVPLLYLVGILAVDRDAFQRLSPADQQVVREVMGAVFQRLDSVSRRDNREAREALRKQGILFDTPSPPELERWHAIAREATTLLGEQGVYSNEMLKLLRSYLPPPRRSHPAPDG